MVRRRAAPSRTMWPVAILRDAASRLLRMRTSGLAEGVIRRLCRDVAADYAGANPPCEWARWLSVPVFAGATLRLHLPELDALAVRLPGRDVAAVEAGLALRHLLPRTAQGLPPRLAMRPARP